MTQKIVKKISNAFIKYTQRSRKEIMEDVELRTGGKKFRSAPKGNESVPTTMALMLEVLLDIRDKL